MEYLTIDDLKYKAKKKVPKAFHDYVRSGSWTETTLKNNSNDFQKFPFDKELLSISNRNTKRFIRHRQNAGYSCGFAWNARADGEILAAQAAEVWSSFHFLPCLFVHEEVARNTSEPFGFNSM